MSHTMSPVALQLTTSRDSSGVAVRAAASVLAACTTHSTTLSAHVISEKSARMHWDCVHCVCRVARNLLAEGERA
jgi:hypothetical protein